MRNINRIDMFLKELGDLWKRVPDFRFFQFIMYIMESIETEKDLDLFFTEDEEALILMKEVFNKTPETEKEEVAALKLKVAALQRDIDYLYENQKKGDIYGNR